MQAPVILILKNNKGKPGWVSCAGICLCWVRDWVFARPGWMVAPRQGLSCQLRVGFNPEAFLWGKKFSWEKDFLRKKKKDSCGIELWRLGWEMLQLQRFGVSRGGHTCTGTPP